MAIIKTGGQLVSMRSDSARTTPNYQLSYSPEFGITFADIWRTQPAVRTVVGYIARNIAQLGLHVFARVSDTERTRLTDGPVADLVKAPNAWTTAYGWIDAIIHDLCIYGNSFWVKIPSGDRAAPLWLLRLQPEQVAIEGNTWQIAHYVYTPKDGEPVSLDADQVVHLKTYNALDPRLGLSPLETLRDVLAADKEAVDWYRAFQKNHGRMSGVIERPADAPKWSDGQRDAFAKEWKAMYSGAQRAGATAVLEDGMTFKTITSTPKDALFLDLRKLTTEQVAAAYFVPPSMVGLSEKGTSWASEREHSRMLFRDTLPPWMEQVTQDLERQLLPDLGAGPEVYLEFNLRAKLEGDFTEQAQAFQMQVGAPIMTRNEARARLNLPKLDEGDELITPLNVAMGAVASPRDTDPASFLSRGYEGKRSSAERQRDYRARKKQEWLDQPRKAASGQLRVTHEAMKDELRQRWDAGERTIRGLFDVQAWDRRVIEQMRSPVLKTLENTTKDLSETILGDVEVMQGMEDTLAAHAKAHNADVMRGIAEVLKADDPDAAFDELLAHGFKKPRELVDTWFDGHETQATGLLGRRLEGATKTWVVTSANPRPEHALMNGETVPAKEPFSNGLMWPRDSSASPEHWLHCQCELVINPPEET